MSYKNDNKYNVFELVWALLMLLVAVYVYQSASSFPLLPGNPVGPGTFPTVIAAILFPCGMLILIQNLSVLRKQRVFHNHVSGISGRKKTLLFILVLLVPLSNILFSELVGFVLTSTMATALLMSVMRQGKLLSSLLIAFTAVAFFSWIFSEYLLVPLPEGTLF